MSLTVRWKGGWKGVNETVCVCVCVCVRACVCVFPDVARTAGH